MSFTLAKLFRRERLSNYLKGHQITLSYYNILLQNAYLLLILIEPRRREFSLERNTYNTIECFLADVIVSSKILILSKQ